MIDVAQLGIAVLKAFFVLYMMQYLWDVGFFHWLFRSAGGGWRKMAATAVILLVIYLLW